MKLAKCPECSRIIDIDELDELDSNEVIGCGLKEGNYIPCENCPEETRPDGCREIRHEDGWTKTTVADFEGGI